MAEQRVWGASTETQGEPGKEMQQHWESQWQDFLKTLQPHHTKWEESVALEDAPWENAKAFLISFEQVAKACRWPREEWAARLLPALSGEAEGAFQSLETRDKEDYVKVKAAILKGDALRMERQRQHFRQFCCHGVEDPRNIHSQLQELCRRWLRPERHSKEQILELLILEQFLAGLPPDLQTWIRARGPDTCSQAVALVEDFLVSQQVVETGTWQEPMKQEHMESLAVEEEPLDAARGQICKEAKQSHDAGKNVLGSGIKRPSQSSSSVTLERQGRSHQGVKEEPMDLMETSLSLQRVEQNQAQPDRETIVWQVLQEEDGKFNALDVQKKPMQFPYCMLKKETNGRRADQGRNSTHSSATRKLTEGQPHHAMNVNEAFTLYDPKNRKWTDSERRATQGASEESSEIEYSSGSDLEDGKGHYVTLKDGKRHHVNFCENVIVGMAAQGNASVSEAEEDYERSAVPDQSGMDVEEVSATSEKCYVSEIPSMAKSKLHTHPGLLQEGGEIIEEEEQNNMSYNVNSLYAVQKERQDKEQGSDNDNIITIIDLETDVAEFNPTTETKKCHSYNVDDSKLDYMSLDNDLEFGTDSLMLMARSVAGGEMVEGDNGRQPWQCAPVRSSADKEPPMKRRMLGLSQPSVFSGPQRCTLPRSLATEVPREESGGQSRRRTSYVWEHFDGHAQDRLIAVCRLCHAFVRLGKEGGCRRVGTTSMIKHLEHRHPHIVPPRKEVCRVSITPPPNPIVKEVPQTNRAESDPAEKPRVEPPGGKSSAPSGQKQLSVPETCPRPEKYALHSAIAARYNRALARYIAQSMLPFSIVEDETFLEFLKELAPRWKVPSRYYLCRIAFPALEKDIKKEILNDLRNAVAGAVHFTSDCWTSNQARSYLCVTAHWVSTQEGVLAKRTATLTLTLFSESHREENIGAKLRNVVAEWLAPLKLEIGCLAADNRSEFLKYIRQKGMSHVPCIVHCINLVVHKALRETSNSRIKKVLELAHIVCSHFRQSCSAIEAVRLLQKKHNLPNHKFILNVPTRWNSTLYMLERLLEQKKAVNEYIQEKAGDLASTLYMQPDQWFIIEDLVDILQIFNECTTVLSSENATLGVVLPALHVMEFSLERNIEEMQNRPGMAANQKAIPAVAFAAQLLESLHNNKHLLGIRTDLKYLAATFLEPRYRNSIRDRLQSTGNNQFWSLQEYIIKKSVHFYKKLHNSTGRAMADHGLPSYAFPSVVPRNPDAVIQPRKQLQNKGSPVGSSAPCHQMAERSRFHDLILATGYAVETDEDAQFDNQMATEQDAYQVARQELDAYIRDIFPARICRPQANPIAYWDEKFTIWPSLARAAIWHICSPPSSVPAKRLFSTTGNIVTKLRTRFAPKHVTRMAFLRANRAWIPQNHIFPPCRDDIPSGKDGQDLSDEGDTDEEISLGDWEAGDSDIDLE
ncbi:uncharacterized protein LOC121921799 [Sceloporus undulatus]|uniref:uncharacterized protein LOC121921799 n=1 Tax=Sceloporus undulatus TaxID=8520 RepID=UPI001C4AC68C|nr:uncharacterized protein LOC121921799 [Sceloporus undulatus]